MGAVVPSPVELAVVSVVESTGESVLELELVSEVVSRVEVAVEVVSRVEVAVAPPVPLVGCAPVLLVSADVEVLPPSSTAPDSPEPASPDPPPHPARLSVISAVSVARVQRGDLVF
jgi:hypothetical protein